jgi:hypothetical protein
VVEFGPGESRGVLMNGIKMSDRMFCFGVWLMFSTAGFGYTVLILAVFFWR